MLNVSCIILILFINFANSQNLSALPPIYHLDDYTKCRQNHQHYCHIEIELLPLSEGNTTEMWSLIEFTKKSLRLYDHSRLHYGICVENHCEFAQNDRELVVNLEDYYSGKYREMGLKARILQIDCNNYDNIYTTSTYDWIVLYSFIAYFLLLSGATLYHYTSSKKSATINKYLLPFSLINNYKKLMNSVESDRLKYIQGFRFYSTIFVVYAHTLLSFYVAYVKDTDYFENFIYSPIKITLGCLLMYIVQSYFLLSGWFLAYNSFKTFHKSPKLNMKRFVLLTFINRYLRIGIPLGICVAAASSSWLYKNFYGPVKHIYADLEYKTCQTYWWMNMLFLNNQYWKPMCYVVSWYLSADTQLYILSLFLLVIIWTHQRWLKVLIGVPILIGILTQIFIIYRYNFDVIFRLVPKKATQKLLQSPEGYFLYTATYLNIPSYLIGIGFGYLHYKYGKKVEFYQNNLLLSKWWLSFIGLPGLAIILAMFRYNRLTSSILAAILKPMYALGVAIGVFGMSYEKNSIIKRLLEWKPVVFLGNVTFSTYLSHYVFIFHRTLSTPSPMRVSDWILFTAVVQDLIMAFLIGILIYLTFELPVVQLRKLLLPKIKND